MTKHENIAKALKARLSELTNRVVEIDSELRKPLSADFEEQATDLENQGASREPADVAHALGAFSCLVGLRAAVATIVGCIEPGGKLLRWSVGHDARCSTTYGAREPVGDVFFQI